MSDKSRCASLFGLAFLTAALPMCSAALLQAQVFQWSDGRGVIHFTDSLDRVPEAIRNSPKLIVRMDLDLQRGSFQTSGPQAIDNVEEAVEREPGEVRRVSEPEPAKFPAPVIHYNPQHYTIVVINSVVRKPKRSECPSPQGCRGTFRPNFDDRRFIHPSVFDGGPRQYVRP